MNGSHTSVWIDHLQISHETEICVCCVRSENNWHGHRYTNLHRDGNELGLLATRFFLGFNMKFEKLTLQKK